MLSGAKEKASLQFGTSKGRKAVQTEMEKLMCDGQTFAGPSSTKGQRGLSANGLAGFHSPSHHFTLHC